MKKIITVVAAFVLSHTAALAGPFYVSTSFGPNWDEDSSLPFVSEDTGLVGTVALGTYVKGVNGLRFEIEAGYRTHDSTFNPPGPLAITLEHDTTTVMANAVYDFSGMDRVVPYVLLGAGVAHTELTAGGLSLLTVENDGFAWQAGVGVNYRLTDSVEVGLGYRYLEAPQLELFGFELDGGGNHAVLATATIALN